MTQPRWCAVGIDPGKRGGIATLYEGGHASAHPLDTGDAVAVDDALRRLRGKALRLSVAIEKVHAFPGQGRAGIFNFGKSAGVPEGVAVALDYHLTFVGPRKWQKFAGIALPTGLEHKKERKELLMLSAVARWPEAGPLSSGTADALWIAWWLACTRFYAEE